VQPEMIDETLFEAYEIERQNKLKIVELQQVFF
jgi:hypothetical protein